MLIVDDSVIDIKLNINSEPENPNPYRAIITVTVRILPVASCYIDGSKIVCAMRCCA